MGVRKGPPTSRCGPPGRLGVELADSHVCDVTNSFKNNLNLTHWIVKKQGLFNIPEFPIRGEYILLLCMQAQKSPQRMIPFIHCSQVSAGTPLLRQFRGELEGRLLLKPATRGCCTPPPHHDRGRRFNVALYPESSRSQEGEEKTLPRLILMSKQEKDYRYKTRQLKKTKCQLRVLTAGIQST